MSRLGLFKGCLAGKIDKELQNWFVLILKYRKEVEMPKMKTKSGAKKRFRVTASCKIRGSAAFLSHNLRRRSQKMKRQARGTMILHDADARIVRKFLPYA